MADASTLFYDYPSDGLGNPLQLLYQSGLYHGPCWKQREKGMELVGTTTPPMSRSGRPRHENKNQGFWNYVEKKSEATVGETAAWESEPGFLELCREEERGQEQKEVNMWKRAIKSGLWVDDRARGKRWRYQTAIATITGALLALRHLQSDGVEDRQDREQPRGQQGHAGATDRAGVQVLTITYYTISL